MPSLSALEELLIKDKEHPWEREDAIELAKAIEAICPEFGCHVAFTGGCLYKEGKRKDADFLFYRIRQSPAIDEKGLLEALPTIGIEIIKRHGWVVKASYLDKPIDLFFPEQQTIDKDGQCLDNQYPEGRECPACGKERREDKNGEWIHLTEDERCQNRILENDEVYQTKDHTHHCKNCAEQVRYDIGVNGYVHRNRKNVTVDPNTFELKGEEYSKWMAYNGEFDKDDRIDKTTIQTSDCERCGNTYHHLPLYKGGNLCPNCFEHEIKLKKHIMKERDAFDGY
jgi:hypothetical protein